MTLRSYVGLVRFEAACGRTLRTSVRPCGGDDFTKLHDEPNTQPFVASVKEEEEDPALAGLSEGEEEEGVEEAASGGSEEAGESGGRGGGEEEESRRSGCQRRHRRG